MAMAALVVVLAAATEDEVSLEELSVEVVIDMVVEGEDEEVVVLKLLAFLLPH
jgi:hypothetical protein